MGGELWVIGSGLHQWVVIFYNGNTIAVGIENQDVQGGT